MSLVFAMRAALLLHVLVALIAKPKFTVGICMTRTHALYAYTIATAMKNLKTGFVIPLEGANYTGGVLQDFDVEYE